METGGSKALSVHCVAESVGAGWEAICLDFDLAVQGSSFEDVYAKLNDQIELYVQTVSDLPAADRDRLLSRRVPYSVMLRAMMRSFGSVLLRRGVTPRHDYVMPLNAPLAA